jgi:hypothetical protein
VVRVPQSQVRVVSDIHQAQCIPVLFALVNIGASLLASILNIEVGPKWHYTNIVASPSHVNLNFATSSTATIIACLSTSTTTANMLPDHLLESYHRYKSDTDIFATWLCNNAEACGYRCPVPKSGEVVSVLCPIPSHMNAT